MGKGEVIILGVNGHIGRAAAQAFVAAGWSVSGMARRAPADLQSNLPGLRFVQGDADDVASLRAAIGSADIVVNALNLPYDKWDQGRMEAQVARVIAAMGNTGKTLLFPGNIYNYAASDRVITPDTPQNPETPRGAIRVRVEQQLAAAAKSGAIQVIILRAGDFYGPSSHNDWFDLAILSSLKKGVIQPMGKPDTGHAWAYLPDLTRAFEHLAAVRHTLGAFETFHFAGHFVTPAQMQAAIVAAAPVSLRSRPFPLWIFALVGLFNPLMRELAKMRYLWANPMALRDDRLAELLGPGFGTPFNTAIAETLNKVEWPAKKIATQTTKLA